MMWSLLYLDLVLCHSALLNLSLSLIFCPLLSVPPRLKEFKSSLFAVFQSLHAQSVGLNALTADLNKERQMPFTADEISAALSRMQDDNQIMLADNIIFLI